MFAVTPMLIVFCLLTIFAFMSDQYLKICIQYIDAERSCSGQYPNLKISKNIKYVGTIKNKLQTLRTKNLYIF